MITMKDMVLAARGYPGPKGSLSIKFNRPQYIQRVAIIGDLNFDHVKVWVPVEGGRMDPFIIGGLINTKQGWDSGTFQPVLADGVQFVGKRGRKSNPVEITLLKGDPKKWGDCMLCEGSGILKGKLASNGRKVRLRCHACEGTGKVPVHYPAMCPRGVITFYPPIDGNRADNGRCVGKVVGKGVRCPKNQKGKCVWKPT